MPAQGAEKAQRLPKRIDTAVQQIYNAKWLYPAAPPNATYSFNSAFAPHRAQRGRMGGREGWREGWEGGREGERECVVYWYSI
jgi:hypothetical protein